MELSKETNNLFIQGVDVLPKEENPIARIRCMLKNYLELDNVNFLFGTGSSIIIGARSIQSIPCVIEEAIKTEKLKDECTTEEKNLLYDEFIDIIKTLQNESTNVKRQSWKNDKGEDVYGEIDYSLEKLLNYLLAIDFIQGYSVDATNYKHIGSLITIIKRELFRLCDLDSQPINKSILSDTAKKHLKENRYYYHEYFTKKVLQRPLNLKRVNIFTTNYDLAFDNAFDRLGVNYINGFSGFHNRYFKPETFEYDIFFPGSTTQGKVQRIEKVLRYFKIHGSLTWVNRDPSANCVYGIEELPMELIRKNEQYDSLMIYPTTVKKSYTLDYPYSELFRQFSISIAQTQSVLITFGYSFSDEHINDLIYQALTIPSFTLIIVDFKGTEGSAEIKRLKELNDPRIIIMQGNQLGDFPFFVEQVMPDLIEFDTNAKIAETMQKLYPSKTDEGIGISQSTHSNIDEKVEDLTN